MAMKFGQQRRVNPNPRPPNEPKFKRNANIGGYQNKAAPNRVVSKGGSQRVNKKKSSNTKTAGSTNAGAAAPTQPTFAPPVDPRDSQYWREMASLNYMNEIDEKNMQAANARDKIGYEHALANRAYQEPREVQSLRKSANTAGGIYSTSTQEHLGELGQQQFEQRNALTRNYETALAERAAQAAERKGERGWQENEILTGADERAGAGELEREGPLPNTPNYNISGKTKRQHLAGEATKYHTLALQLRSEGKPNAANKYAKMAQKRSEAAKKKKK